jgi:hypothetical protein
MFPSKRGNLRLPNEPDEPNEFDEYGAPLVTPCEMPQSPITVTIN